MTGKRILLALAVGVLMGAFAGAAIVDAQGMDAYGPWDQGLTYSSESEPESSVGQPEVGESREPMETGSVPDRPESSSNLSSDAQSGHETVEIGGRVFRPGIDDGP